MKPDTIKNVDVIGISYFHGEGQHTILIGTSLGKIDSIFNNDPKRRPTTDETDDTEDVDKIVISQNSMNYLAQYISEHCPEYDSIKTKIPVMGVRIYHGSDINVCIMNNIVDIQNFASGLVKLIDSAGNKNDLSEVREYIAPFKDLSD